MGQIRARWATLALLTLTATCAAPAPQEGMPAAVRRVTATIDDALSVALPASRMPQARPEDDVGRLDPKMRLDGVTLVFNQTPAQKADLAALIAAQLDPRSPHYHAWLAPEEYGARFGMSSADLADIETWAIAHGLALHGRSRGATRLYLGGTVAQVEHAFRTEVHRYVVAGVTHFAMALAPSVPAAFADTVAGVRGASDFGPHAALHFRPAFTNAGGMHFLAPQDLQTIYDLAPLYAQGIDGTGVSLAIVGQSYYVPSDFTVFRSQTGLPPIQLTDVLVPGSGTATYIDVADNEEETELDIEWSGAAAKNAGLVYVYTGGNAGFNVENAIEYAIDNAVAPAVSISYGECEALAAVDTQLDVLLAGQAAAEGVTVFASSGDDGAAGCGHDVAIATQGPEVQLPSSLSTVTAVGGTEFDEGTGTYWSAANGAYGGSATSYIPETAWNDGVVSSLSGDVIASTGGGASTLFAKPVWQTGAGVPNDGARDVPDVALTASYEHDGYLLYLSNIPGEITQPDFYAFGGTSASTPFFAGIMTLLNQATNSGKLGNVNPVLYGLAATAPGAFHDVTSGTNVVPCEEGTTGCPGAAPFQFGFTAGPGYDLVTGLGSVDAAKLAQAWESSLVPMALTLSASPSSLQVEGAIVLTATATAGGSGPAPTGSIAFSSGGVSMGSGAVTASTAANGEAMATVQITIPAEAFGTLSLTARYSGDASYQAATSNTVVVTVSGIPSRTALTASPQSTSEGTSIAATATVVTTASASTPLPTGMVVFASGGSPFASVPLQNGTTASLTLTKVGAYGLTAAYSGDALYLPSTSPGVALAIASTLAVTPASTAAPPRGAVTFTATGNVGAVAWALATNASQGKIDGAGAYTAGSVPDVNDVVVATDPLGGSATATIDVGPGVSIAPPQASASTGGSVTFMASGGSGSGYVWSMATNASGASVASDGTYTAGSTGGVTDSVQVVDSLGNIAVAPVAVSGHGGAPDAGSSAPPDAGSPAVDSGGTSGGAGCGCVIAGAPSGGDGLAGGLGLATLGVAPLVRRRPRSRR